MTWTTSCTGKMSPTGRWVLPLGSLGKHVELVGLTPSLSCPSRVYEYQRIPPLISHVPVKIRRTQVGLGVKSSFSPHKGARKSHLPREQIKREYGGTVLTYGGGEELGRPQR